MYILTPQTTSLVLLLSLSALPAMAAVSTVTVTGTATAGAPVTSATSPSYISDTEFQQDMLDAHNFYRGEHNASALTWNDTSAKYAANWSNACNFQHSGGPTGENLAAGFVNATASVDAWGLEREKYNWKKPGFSEATGHFTQVVWSNTTTVGCGRKSCFGANGTPGVYVVCEYYPPGNIVTSDNSYFVYNVKKETKGKLTDTVETGVTSAGNRKADVMWGAAALSIATVLMLCIAR